MYLLGRPLCRNVSGILTVYILEDFAGDFLEDFFRALFPPQKRGETIRRQNLRKEKKSGSSKIKISKKKKVLPKPTLKLRHQLDPRAHAN